MAITEFSDHQTQQMLQAVRSWLSSQQAGAKLDADAVESFGSDFGLDKPSSHKLLMDLVDEGYLDAEYHTSGSGVTPLRHVEVRGLTDKATGELS